METTIKQPPFNDLQLSIINLVAKGIEDKDLLEIKKMITQYLGKKATEEADKVWEEKGWNDARIDELLNDPNQ